jgi:hypothetical protein
MRVRAIAAVSIAIVMLTGGGIALASSRSQPGAVRHHRNGIVTGKFEREGGPIPGPGQQPPIVPLAGTIRFTAGHRVVRVHAGASGTFTVRLAPGTYRVTARTPSVRGSCTRPAAVKVRPGRTSHVTMICIVP